MHSMAQDPDGRWRSTLLHDDTKARITALSQSKSCCRLDGKMRYSLDRRHVHLWGWQSLCKKLHANSSMRVSLARKLCNGFVQRIVPDASKSALMPREMLVDALWPSLPHANNSTTGSEVCEQKFANSIGVGCGGWLCVPGLSVSAIDV